MITNIISEAYLASALDRQRAATLGIKAERDELLEALRALYDATMHNIDTLTDVQAGALMAARLAILRAERAL